MEIEKHELFSGNVFSTQEFREKGSVKLCRDKLLKLYIYIYIYIYIVVCNTGHLRQSINTVRISCIYQIYKLHT
jgi:hypothetical protein